MSFFDENRSNYAEEHAEIITAQPEMSRKSFIDHWEKQRMPGYFPDKW